MTGTAALEHDHVGPAPAGRPEQPADVPRLRRLPVPQTEPPYDDELDRSGPAPAVLRLVAGPQTDPGSSAGTAVDTGRGAAAALGQEALPLAFVLPSGLPVLPEAPRLDRAPAPRRLPEDGDLDPDFDPQPTPRSALPEPQGWAGRLVQAVVEVLAGHRPAAQLVRWTSEDVYDEVRRRVQPARRDHGHAGSRPVVRSVHVCEPADGVAEISARVQRGVRATAVAVRLEGVDGRWQCTALEVH